MVSYLHPQIRALEFLLFSHCRNAPQISHSLQELLVQKSPVQLELNLASHSGLNFFKCPLSSSNLITHQYSKAGGNSATVTLPEKDAFRVRAQQAK